MYLTPAVWLTATIAHFLLTYRLARRLVAPTDRDHLIWTWAALSVGGLSALLHVLATLWGISLAGGVAALLVAHAAAAWLVGRGPRSTPERMSWAETAALTMGLALVLTGVLDAGQSTAVEGTDAAHYHAPNALNLAGGGRVFDLPATPHLYPVAASLIGAWFIVPFGTPLLLESSMLLPLLLLASSMNLIFRTTTGLPGLGWASWLVVALLSLPLFRFASHFSADLWFASAYVAMTAVLLRAWPRRFWSVTDVTTAALVLGVLLGSKTTGLAAAALLVGTYVLLLLLRRKVHRPAGFEPWKVAGGIGLLFALSIAAGGIWLIRNWFLFGSPIAPNGWSVLGVSVFPGEPVGATTYLSVVGDMQAEGYDVLQQALRYSEQWLSPWFVWMLGPLLLLVPVDLAIGAWRREWTPFSTARVILFVLLLLPGILLLWLLAGAPWTSLEWTQGFSLRYALPLWALAALTAFVTLFSCSWRWYQDTATRTLAGALTLTLALWMFIDSMTGSGARFTPLPRISAGGGLAALLIMAAAGLGRWRPRLRAGVLALLVLVAGGGWLATAVERSSEERAAALARLDHERRNPDLTERHRRPFLAAMEAENAAGLRCEARRFIMLTRFDLPLSLQDPDYSSLVYYAGRNVESAAAIGAIAECDYVVATAPYLETDRGTAIVTLLSNGQPMNRIETGNEFVLLTVAPRQD